MTTGTMINNCSSLVRRRFWTSVSAETCALRFCTLPVRRPLSPRPLCIEQRSSHQVQIRQRRRHLQTVQVLRQAPIAHLAEAEDVLDHTEHVLDFGADAQLVSVLRFRDLVDSALKATSLVTTPWLAADWLNVVHSRTRQRLPRSSKIRRRAMSPPLIGCELSRVKLP